MKLGKFRMFRKEEKYFRNFLNFPNFPKRLPAYFLVSPIIHFNSEISLSSDNSCSGTGIALIIRRENVSRSYTDIYIT